MAKIFPYDPAEAMSRAQAARRQATRETAISAEAERRRQEGERVALREREMHIWFERESAAEAAQERATLFRPRRNGRRQRSSYRRPPSLICATRFQSL
jgi:hypothetical protein